MGQTPCHDAEDFNLFEALDWRVFGVVGAEQPTAILLPVQPLHDWLVVDVRDDDIAYLRCPGAVDDQPCAVQDSGRRHAVALSFSEPNMRSP